MQFYKCVCGEIESFGSLSPNPCEPCDECGSVPTLDRSRKDPVPHNFSAHSSVETNEGTKTLTRCRFCHRSKVEIEKDKVLNAALKKAPNLGGSL